MKPTVIITLTISVIFFSLKSCIWSFVHFFLYPFCLWVYLIVYWCAYSSRSSTEDGNKSRNCEARRERKKRREMVIPGPDERESNIEEEVKSETVKVLETGNTRGLNWRKLDNGGRRQTAAQTNKLADTRY